MSQPTSAAFFDIDGTLTVSQTMIRWILNLSDDHPTKRHHATKLRSLIKTYQECRPYHYSDVVEEAVRLVDCTGLDNILNDLTQAEVERTSLRTVDELIVNLYRFSQQLILWLRSRPQPVLLFAITGSPLEISQPLCERLGFYRVFGGVFTKNQGRYTGENNNWNVYNKGLVVERLMKEYNLNPAFCIAVGDTFGDVGMFERVGYSIAFNPAHNPKDPQRDLLKYVREHPKTACVFDRQKSGVQAFRSNSRRQLIEIRQLDSILPPIWHGFRIEY